MTSAAGQRGFTVIELLFVVAAAITMTAIAVAASQDAIDELRTAMAARAISSRLAYARMEAIKRSAAVAWRFEPVGGDYRVSAVIDGNANGVRTTEIQSGVDAPLGVPLKFTDQFPGVRLGLLPGIPDADGVPTTDPDGVRIGAARILTMSPDGTATAGTLYLHGRRSQFAVRILGATGRVRVLRFHQGTRTWRIR